jgi:Predicted O-methyltransferase
LELKLYDPLPTDPGAVLKFADEYQLYQVVAAACKVHLFESLQAKQSAGSLARQKGWDEVTTARLLHVLHHLGYLAEDAGTYQNAVIAAQFLLPGKLLYLGHQFPPDFSPGSLGFKLIRCLTKAPDCQESPEPDWNPERLRQIGVSGLSGSLQATVAAIDLPTAGHLLDLGGGHGFYSIALAQKYPSLTVTLYDLPQIIELANEYVRAFHLAERIRPVAGDFLRQDIGTGYDAVLCANILHSTKRDIVLDKVWQALAVGGRIIVKCRIADCPDTPATAMAKLIWQVRGGKELFSRDHWQQLLARQGFKEVTTLNVHGIFATMAGIKQ